GELQERKMVLWLFRPADQERAVAVEPGVAGLDDPSACPPAGRVQLLLELVGAAADVRGVVALRDHLVDRPLIGAIKTQTLRALLARPGPVDRDRVERRG